jgi:hypothetical protein
MHFQYGYLWCKSCHLGHQKLNKMKMQKKLPSLTVFPWTPWQKELNKDGIKAMFRLEKQVIHAFAQFHPICGQAAF